METHNIINEMADILEIIRNNGRYELQMFEG